jgi:hypothetical protein
VINRRNKRGALFDHTVALTSPSKSDHTVAVRSRPYGRAPF